MQDDDSEDDYDEVDRDALQRAISIRYGSVKGKIELLELLTTRSWCEVAEAAAYHCQIEVLGLRPWEKPPCHADDIDQIKDDGSNRMHRRREAAALLDRMLAVGLSQWEPDVPSALAKAEREAKHK